ncbi:MAG: peptide deformylase, partial [Sphingobacteriia bacterium]|nr:peptide deformylase [Sphingobacteriia bacterium]
MNEKSTSMKIVTYPDPILDKKAEKIKNPLDKEIQALIPEMLDTMRKNNGLGLAAPQVGKSLQLCIIEYQGKIFTLINPKITSHTKELE